MRNPGYGSQNALVENNLLYEDGLAWIRSLEGKAAATIEASSYLSRFAWFHHPGRFADGAVENAVFRIGNSSSRKPALAPNSPSRNPGRSQTLHVASEIYNVGGHTRLLAKWIMRDKGSAHHVILTRQRLPFPEFFKTIVEDSGTSLVCLPQDDEPINRAIKLRGLSTQFDRIILHTHFDDPIPILAFAVSGGPPVVMFNHAHFGFCLGSTVSDLIVNTFGYFQEISAKFRFARRTALLPVTLALDPLALTEIDKETAKADLGISKSCSIIMTIGHEGYFRPAAGYDFFATLAKLLRGNPTVHFLGVGIPPDSHWIPSSLHNHRQCHFVGPVVDPSPYYRAADICLESFPFPSLGGLVEAVAYGESFPVPVYGVGESILRIEQRPLLEFTYRPTDEAAYIDYINQLLSDVPSARERAKGLRLSIAEFDDQWGERLAELNTLIDSLKHEPLEIPKAPMSDSVDSCLLAQLRPCTLAEKVNDLFPLGRAIRFNLWTLANGFTSFREIGTQTFARIFRAIKRRSRLSSSNLLLI